MKQIVIYLSMIQKFTNLKQKIVASSICLRNISKDCSTDNLKRKQALMDLSLILV